MTYMPRAPAPSAKMAERIDMWMMTAPQSRTKWKQQPIPPGQERSLSLFVSPSSPILLYLPLVGTAASVKVGADIAHHSASFASY